jgi:hypothetical protein
VPKPSVAYAEPLVAPLPVQGQVESWEVNVREEEVAWLTGKRDVSWWTGECWVLLVADATLDQVQRPC